MPESNVLIGYFNLNDGGYGFVTPKNSKTGDIFIAARNINSAFHGDKVEVVLFAKQKGKNLEGQIVDIIVQTVKKIIEQEMSVDKELLVKMIVSALGKVSSNSATIRISEEDSVTP